MASLTFGQSLTWWKDFATGFSNVFIGGFLPELKPEHIDLSGKTAIVTGANSGIGLQMTMDFARQGATVYLACRSSARAQQAIDSIIAQYPEAKGKLHFIQLDTGSLENVRSFAKSWAALENNKIDILCHNAGIVQPPSQDQFYSVDGFEILYATNFLSSFLLTHLLESYLSSTARIILTTSVGSLLTAFSPDFAVNNAPIKNQMEVGFHCPVFHLFGKKIIADDDNSRYNNGKAMQVAFAASLQQHFDHKAAAGGGKSRPIAHAFSPGFTETPILGKLSGLSWIRDPVYSMITAGRRLATPVSQGAATGSWLATTNNKNVVDSGKAGGYWERMARRMGTGDTAGQEMLDRLWARWEKDAGVEWRL